MHQVIKVCGLMVDYGKMYVNHQSMFANSLWEITLCFKGDQNSLDNLKKIIQVFHDMGKFQNILLEQATKTVLTNFSTFVKE